MNAEEIRDMKIGRSGVFSDPSPEQIHEFQCAMLQEIAAQLAELNKSVQSYDRTDGTRIFDVQVREATR